MKFRVFLCVVLASLMIGFSYYILLVALPATVSPFGPYVHTGFTRFMLKNFWLLDVGGLMVIIYGIGEVKNAYQETKRIKADDNKQPKT